MNIQKFIFGVSEIEFDLRQGKNMMVNATEMAKPFGKLPKDFLRNEDVKMFLEECLKKDNSPFLGVSSMEDLITSKQKSGTWMHRVVALKFAAWLNPAFELWVYMTIDQLLFDFAYEIEDSMSETVKFQKEQDKLKNQLAKENPTYLEILKLDGKINDSKNRRRKATKLKFSELKDNLFTQNQEEE